MQDAPGDRFAGDRILILFNDPLPVTEPASRAAAMARRCGSVSSRCVSHEFEPVGPPTLEGHAQPVAAFVLKRPA